MKELIAAYLSTFDRELEYEIIFRPHTYNSGATLIHEDNKVQVYSFPINHRVPTCGFLFKEKQRLPNLNKFLIDELNIPIKELQGIKEGKGFQHSNGQYYTHEQLTELVHKPRSFAFVSDTAKCERIIPIIKNVDLLYHEATFSHSDKKRAKQTGHSTAIQAAEIARDANVKQLIIGHFSTKLKDINPLLDEAKSIFPNTFLAKDGELFDVPFDNN